ncbi:MAG TPA: histidine kinase dimerization/phospho-acceptor domain-containing protein [Sphingomicrobium sp.]|nr:histidine kinase dimerization/phospho-acceptor domain-containing protein [Sphingomicrobium sp.]
MRFDDRLRTVLAQPAADPHDRAVRWRQLVELVARSSPQADPKLIDQAIAEIRDGASRVDERVRTATALAVAPLQLSTELVACFAAEPIAVAAPVLASARLTAAEWTKVSAVASEECRAFIAAIHSSKPSQQQQASIPHSESGGGGSSAVPSIGDVVARIERLRQQRKSDGGSESLPDAAGEELPRLFRWECNEAGEIDWVEGAPRGALVGQSIAQRGPGGGVDPGVERAFAARAPFHEGVLELPADTRAGGAWKISGIPAFERATGRFAGYRGLAERFPAAPSAAADAALDPDSLRELAHEIKTPLNAIIGFAEIITGEYFGPAGKKYRVRAAEIAAQARLLHSAVEDLDFAAKLRSRDPSAVAELADALAQSWDLVERLADERGVRISVTGGIDPARCSLDPQLAARLAERLCTAVIEGAAQGETVTFQITSDAEHCEVRVTCPAALRNIDLSPERNRRAADFATLPLRLVRSLARTAGGELIAIDGELVLRLPRA